jgi:hypothetical protein
MTSANRDRATATAPRPRPPRPPHPELGQSATDTRLRWIARAAFTLMLIALIAWFARVMVNAPLTPLVVVGALAAVVLLLRLGSLQAVARRRR